MTTATRRTKIVATLGAYGRSLERATANRVNGAPSAYPIDGDPVLLVGP